MVAQDAALMAVMRAIVAGDAATASRLLASSPELATARITQGATRQSPTDHFFVEIRHYVYAGDTVLHVVAAAYQVELIGLLITMNADVDARNRRGASPLHYAVDGGPGSASWNPAAQAETVAGLVAAGADPNGTDKSGVTPLHRAVRNRCSAAVAALLDLGADATRTNKSGSTPLQLATWTTGRGGTGSPEAKAEQEKIIQLLSAQRH